MKPLTRVMFLCCGGGIHMVCAFDEHGQRGAWQGPVEDLALRAMQQAGLLTDDTQIEYLGPHEGGRGSGRFGDYRKHDPYWWGDEDVEEDEQETEG